MQVSCVKVVSMYTAHSACLPSGETNLQCGQNVHTFLSYIHHPQTTAFPRFRVSFCDKDVQFRIYSTLGILSMCFPVNSPSLSVFCRCSPSLTSSARNVLLKSLLDTSSDQKNHLKRPSSSVKLRYCTDQEQATWDFEDKMSVDVPLE